MLVVGCLEVFAVCRYYEGFVDGGFSQYNQVVGKLLWGGVWIREPVQDMFCVQDR
jgi:hypothetical protein